MKVFVKVKIKAPQEYVKKVDQTHLEVAVQAAPERGKANEAVLKLIAEYLGVPAYDVRIVSGASSRQKVIEIRE